MQTQVDFFDGMRKLISHHNIISISGESGTGKTTLALQLIGLLLTSEHAFEDTCIWIQASDIFPLKRLTQIFKEQENKLEYIQNNIFVIPPTNPIRTYKQQSLIIRQIFSAEGNLPPYLKYIVIDNISHHLRYTLTHYHIPKEATQFLDAFYETQLMPLIMFCKRKGIILMLIHEVSYNPKDQCNRPFYHKLYDRIRTIDIILNKGYNKEKNNLQIIFDKLKWNFEFTIETNCIKIL